MSPKNVPYGPKTSRKKGSGIHRLSRSSLSELQGGEAGPRPPLKGERGEVPPEFKGVWATKTPKCKGLGGA